MYYSLRNQQLVFDAGLLIKIKWLSQMCKLKILFLKQTFLFRFRALITITTNWNGLRFHYYSEDVPIIIIIHGIKL